MDRKSNETVEMSSTNQFENTEDHELDNKIKRTKKLLARSDFFKLPDDRKKLRILLGKLLAERERRNRLQLKKAENSMPTSVQVLERIDGSSAVIGRRRRWINHKTAAAIAAMDQVQAAEVVVAADQPQAAEAAADQPQAVVADQPQAAEAADQPQATEVSDCHQNSPLQHIYKGRESSSGRTYDNRISEYPANNFNVKSGKEDLSQRQNKISRCSGSSYLFREENASSQYVVKRKSVLLTPQGQTKKKVAKLIVLDEEDNKQPKQPRLDKMSERWMKDVKVYYPTSDDLDCVEICYFDMECLDPFSYLSSPVMNFYIRYLQRPESLTPSQRNNYHFFNTYFYNKLHEALCDQRQQKNDDSLVKLRRWLKGVNIFEKAYVFLPIHYSLHWSLAIICFPAKEDKSGPLVLHLDSLGLHSSSIIFQNILRFLKMEWEHLNQTGLPTHIPIEESIRKTLISKIENRTIQVPQQDNDYDCGLFVLFFIERFIKDAPERIKKDDLNMFGKRWFRPAEASCLRSSIRGLLQKQFEDARNSR